MFFLRPNLGVRHIIVTTDHSALNWLLMVTEVTGKLTRWRMFLLQLDFEDVHRAGVKQHA